MRERSEVSDRIALTGLRVPGRHGVYDFEREQGQDFVVDVVLEIDTRQAAASDDLADTVNYGDLATGLADVVGGEPVNLLETLGRAAGRCLPRRPAGQCGGGHGAQAAGADPAHIP